MLLNGVYSQKKRAKLDKKTEKQTSLLDDTPLESFTLSSCGSCWTFGHAVDMDTFGMTRAEIEQPDFVDAYEEQRGTEWSECESDDEDARPSAMQIFGRQRGDIIFGKVEIVMRVASEEGREHAQELAEDLWRTLSPAERAHLHPLAEAFSLFTT